ncbi:sigma factor-like helix-turn-helix DNA-binding protein [Streptomyces sp. P9(2023)]|uniref:sigma factor-like helix-turn-helix DNA-binding protein n=1 Tax=Streptomyces sp. P9(2023) TaxID=3064394 RepID=UPI0028F41C77|nr:sigma factor-like helix-turn-helix DNA-binding protein [Streptomyces sp. P9(2023)]MDT9688725.1 sigma factor-like helix-turn-helix DNA-binding protein [Streptomyces sp. P9(2023)]
MNRSIPSPKERRRLREARGLSEDQLAEAMGVTRATVRSWETGRTTPRGRKQEAYAKLIGAYEDEGSPTPDEPKPPQKPNPTSTQAPTQAPARTPTPTHSPAPRPQLADSARPAANTRPRAATKRAAKPPKAPAAATLGLGSGSASGPGPGSGFGQKAPRAVRAGSPAPAAQQPLEKLKPAEPSAEPPAEPVAERSSLTPEEAFDALYAYAAPGLVHQTYLLTGRRRLSRESVEHAFHHAWQHWPEVAVDRDPVGWVRAAAYEYALSPWHRLRRSHKHPDVAPTEAGRRNLLAALLELPPPYRRTVLLYDGLGLDLPETAAETEASTPAAANRLLHARTVIGQHVPELADPDALRRRLGALVAEAPTATLADARTVRTRSERRARMWTRAVLGVTAALIGATAFTVATAPTRYLPVNHPGETVNGVPVRGGSQQLTPQDVELRDSLRSQPHPGPERLIPDPH